jgi:hypothetical protein
MPHVESCVLAQPAVHSTGDHDLAHRAVDGDGRRHEQSNSARRRGRRAGQSQAGRSNRSQLAPDAATGAPQERAGGWREHVDLGLLSRLFPVARLEAILARQGLGESHGRLPPARTIYLVLGLCVFARASYQEVLARFWPGCAGVGEAVPNKSSLCRARLRLNCQVLDSLFRTTAQPLATALTPGAFWNGLRIMAIDGLTLDVPASSANEQAFGGQRDRSGRRVGFPQIRLLGLVECATLALVDAALGGYGDGEQELAAQLVRSVCKGMLVLADRGFLSVTLWRTYHDAGAHLLWRLKGNVATKVVERLPDGTYLAQIRPSRRRWTLGQRPPTILVRVIEYRLAGSRQLYRLATSLLDPQYAPAQELARLYARRWMFETAADELKTHQRGGGVVLRSCSPDGVRQEVWAHLLLHYGARKLMFEAACTLESGPNPARISFTLALNIIQRSILQAPFLPRPDHLVAAAFAELTQPRSLIRRRPRSYPRTIKHPSSRYPGQSGCPNPPSSRTSQASITLVSNDG